jgi:hypothetical protein
LYNIKKAPSIYFSFTIWKKKLNQRKEKKKEKNKIENILKGKKN